MKRLFIVGLVIALFSGTAYAADTKGSALSAPAALATTDALYVIDNPAGTPISCKDTIANILGLGSGSIFNAYDADLTTWAGITPGANVGTALAIAIGTAGAPVTFNGALGTPSSGTLTNCTGPFESNTSNNFDPDRVSGDTTDDNALDVAVMPTAAPGSGDTTHVSTAGQIYTWCVTTMHFLADLVNDTTPQLGGDLDTNSHSITGLATMSLAAPAGDPADAGAIRLENAAVIGWEDGTECTITHVNDTGLETNLDFVANGNLHGGIAVIADDTSLSAAQCRGSLNKCNGAETITLPAATVGMNVMIYSDDATVKVIDADGTENIWLNGADQGDGVSIQSPGAVGNYIVLVCMSAGNWYTLGQSGVWIVTP